MTFRDFNSEVFTNKSQFLPINSYIVVGKAVKSHTGSNQNISSL